MADWSKQALRHYFCPGAKGTGVDKNTSTRASQEHQGASMFVKSASNGTASEVMQYKINLSYKLGRLSFCPGNEHVCPVKRRFWTGKGRRWKHTHPEAHRGFGGLWGPEVLWAVERTAGTGQALENFFWDKTMLQGRRNRLDVIKHP